MGEPIITGKIPARAVDPAATILADVDDLEPWPLAPGALVAWRDDGRPGARFCASLAFGALARFVPEPYRHQLEAGPFPWHGFDTGYVDRDGPVLAGLVRRLDCVGDCVGDECGGGELVAVAQAHAAPGGVVLAGRLAHWLDPAPYRAWFGISAEWSVDGEGEAALRDVRVVDDERVPGHPVHRPGLGKARRALEGGGG